MLPSDFRSEPKVLQWEKALRDAGCTINGLTPISLLHSKNGELLFALCEANVTDPQKKKLPKYIFIRGHAAIVVALLRNKDTGVERYLMIRQRRIGNGTLNLEFPAGMLDREINNVEAVAVKELLEETGLSITTEALRPLHKGPLYSSPGACDEGIFYFGCIVPLSNEEFSSFEGRKAGSKSDGESTAVCLCTQQEAEEETTSLQVRLGFYLFNEYLRNIRRA
ncbi:MAG TPA: NUDIX hydrolase [Chitinivibrionales bacterium]|nr:NUDIX hydrolase [Chitinivibrionales bacterium]